MAKTLRDPAPSSAVARLLNIDAANRAMEPIASSASQSDVDPRESDDESFHAVQAHEIHRVKREFILTDETEATFCEALELFRRTTRARLTASQLFRAMLKALRGALPALQYEAHQLGPMRLPGNGRQAQTRRNAFEERIAAAIAAGMRVTAASHPSAHEPAQTRDRPGR